MFLGWISMFPFFQILPFLEYEIHNQLMNKLKVSLLLQAHISSIVYGFHYIKSDQWRMLEFTTCIMFEHTGCLWLNSLILFVSHFDINCVVKFPVTLTGDEPSGWLSVWLSVCGVHIHVCLTSIIVLIFTLSYVCVCARVGGWREQRLGCLSVISLLGCSSDRLCVCLSHLILSAK